ncbi:MULTISPECIES: cytochrome c nitrite reductase small subunit [Geobacter]|uniref:Cytochrome C nitrite reductase n=2 Tax=Geobacter TaxID=28231 RepID=A0A0C1QRJ8_9BACT|nr:MULTISPECIES: cytochrome c nitrite reductase small subunit [Geobacter]ANA41309.1 cytochrome c nitrite reductase small subunit [Geobacter anodireducens]KIE43472.1 cytochrome C nitrite reductase [Geobacter soli]MBE2888739.1 cytochrome c nitrite reductase small subunit [Geobacter anodireducens]HMN02965.1 cytochrome c nitrite reductase small subunit [Geobacter anodireducens]
MGISLSRQVLATTLVVGIAGAAMAAFALVGPPRLLEHSESPAFCAGCHVMGEQHEAWSHAGAHRRIRCVDCHLPNGNPVAHYVWKSIDGMKDVVAFYSGHVPDPITLSSHGAKVVQQNCVRCHEATVTTMDRTRQCWGCHRQLRHKLTGAMATR